MVDESEFQKFVEGAEVPEELVPLLGTVSLCFRAKPKKSSSI